MIRAALRTFAAAAIAIVSTLHGLVDAVPSAYADPMEVFTLWPLADATDDKHPERLLGFNPAEAVSDPSGLTRRVTSSGQLTIVAAANTLLHEGRDSSGTPTTRGPNGLIYWNPVTNDFKTWGTNLGFAAGVDVNRSSATMTIPSRPSGATTFGAGDVWATIQASLGDGPLYVHLRGTNWFRYYQPVIGVNGGSFGAKGVSVDPSTGLIYFSDENAPGTVNRLNPSTNVVTSWILGDFVHYLKARNGIVYVTVSNALAATGQDAVIRLDTNISSPSASNPNISAWQLGLGNFCMPQCSPLTQDVPDGIDVEGNEVWFAQTLRNSVARLSTSTDTLTEFFGHPGVNEPQQIGVQGGGTSVQSFFTEGDGEAISMVKPKANVGVSVKPVAGVAPPIIQSACLPIALALPNVCTFTDAYILPDSANIPPVIRQVPGIPSQGPNGTIWRFPAPAVPVDRGGDEAQTRHPSGITDANSMIVYGTYLAPPIGGPVNNDGLPIGSGGNSAVFKAHEPDGPPATSPPPLLPLPGWRRISGNGAIAVVGSNRPASFAFVVERKQDGAPITGRFHYRNPARGETVISNAIQSVTFVATTATIQGTCLKNGAPCTFTAIVQDNQVSSAVDMFTISGPGINTATGTLSRGDITIRTR
jgi:hypothetical protein